MSIRVIKPEGTGSSTYEGYCHEITITLNLDGSVSPRVIPFGNCGDKNITQFSFNVQSLIVAVPTLKDNYTFSLNIYDPSLPKTNDNPTKYTFTDKFVLPEKYTAKAGTYKCIFCLTENTNDAHNTTDTLEQWVSQVCTAVVNPTVWDDSLMDFFDSITTIVDNAGFLAKPAIILTPRSDHYSIQANNINLGQKMDRYIRRIEMASNSALDSGLDTRYGVFVRETAVSVVKFSIKAQTYTCWVPPEVCSTPGTWMFMVVAQTAEETDGTPLKRWVSNTLLFTIADNFLSSVALTNASFVLANRKLLYTRDAEAFNTLAAAEGEIYQSSYTGEQIDAAIAGMTNKEDKSNKTSTLPSANGQAYPSATAVIDFFENKQGDEIIINGSISKES